MREQNHGIQTVKPFVGQPVQHGLFDKGLDVFTRLWQWLPLSVEIDGHGVAVEGFGHTLSQVILKVFAQQVLGVVWSEVTKVKERPVKSVGKGKSSNEHNHLLAFKKPF